MIHQVRHSTKWINPLFCNLPSHLDWKPVRWRSELFIERPLLVCSWFSIKCFFQSNMSYIFSKGTYSNAFFVRGTPRIFNFTGREKHHISHLGGTGHTELLVFLLKRAQSHTSSSVRPPWSLWEKSNCTGQSSLNFNLPMAQKETLGDNYKVQKCKTSSWWWRHSSSWGS